jgi:hypothetical protein
MKPFSLRTKILVGIAIPLLLIALIRFLPFILYHPDPLGYDTGFYFYAVSQERTALELHQPLLDVQDLKSNLNYFKANSLGLRALLRIFIQAGLSDRAIVYLVPIFFCQLIGVQLYLLARRLFSDQAAQLSLWLYALSFTQFLVYWEVLWRNIIGLSILLSILLLLDYKRRNLIAAAILALLLVMVHKTSAVVLIIILAISAIFFLKKNKNQALILILIFSAASLCFYRDLIQLLAAGWQDSENQIDFFGVKAGIFIDLPSYLKYSALYLPFGIYALFQRQKSSQAKSIKIFIIVLGAWLLFRLFFYQRLLLYFDIWLIIFGGQGILLVGDRIKNFQKYKIFAVAVLGVSLLTVEISWVKLQQPLLGYSEMQAIKTMRHEQQKYSAFTCDSYYTPWLLGFSGHKIIAPGWGDGKWLLEDWQKFWADEDQYQLLTLHNKPLLIMGSNCLSEKTLQKLVHSKNYYFIYEVSKN